MDQIRKRVRDAESGDWVQKLCSVVVDCEVVELARAMWRDYNERRQQYLWMPAITRTLMEVR